MQKIKAIIWAISITISNFAHAQICSGDQFAELSDRDVSLKGQYLIQLNDSTLVFSMNKIYKTSTFDGKEWMHSALYIPNFTKRIKRKRKVPGGRIILKFTDGAEARLLLSGGYIRGIWYYEGKKVFYFWNKIPPELEN